MAASNLSPHIFWRTFSIISLAAILPASAVRLHTLFQYLDGYKSNYYLQGWLHVGNNYAVLLKKPEAHDKDLIYELYETKSLDDVTDRVDNHGPRLLAISKVPVEYIKEQLKTYKIELHKAKYANEFVVPGTQVRTLREWQILRSLDLQKNIHVGEPEVLRARLDDK